MGAVLRWIFSLLIPAGSVLFALANRQTVPVAWSPLHDPYAVPVFGIALGALLFGFVLGGTMVWLNAGPLRRDRRHLRKTVKALEKELAEARPALPVRTIETRTDDS